MGSEFSEPLVDLEKVLVRLRSSVDRLARHAGEESDPHTEIIAEAVAALTDSVETISQVLRLHMAAH